MILNVERKVGAGLSVVLLLMIAIGIVSFRNTNHLLDDTERASSALGASNKASNLLSLMEQQARWTLWSIGVGNGFAMLFVAGCCLLIHRDLLARHRANEEFSQTQQRFQLLVESAKEYAIYMLDPQGCVRTWNIGAQRMKGYSAEEIIGQHFSRFYPLEDIQRGKPERELQMALEHGQSEEDAWRVRKDGSRFWANVVVTTLRDAEGRHVGFSKITRDLTERLRADEKIHNFFTLSLDLLCIAGADGFFKHLNPAWEATLGFTDTELRARPYLDFVHPDDQSETVRSVARLATDDLLMQFENRYRCKDGSYCWLTWKATVSSDRQLIYAVARDVTEHKRDEKAIADLNETLKQGNFQLEAANKELEAFSYSVSHDLRAPLRSLDGFSQALLEDYGDRLDPEGQSHLQRIRAASQRMGQLIDDLINLSRVTRTDLCLENVDMSQMAREIAEELRTEDDSRRVDFVIADGLTAQTDSRLFRVVMTNLLGNAWKFTSKCPNARIEFGSSVQDGVQTYFVRDNGVGFDMTYSGKLFGAFQRLHAATDFPGTGIGLATVQRIVRRQGGRVWAESTLNGGATFYFTL